MQMWIDLLEIFTETAKSDRTVTVLTGGYNSSKIDPHYL